MYNIEVQHENGDVYSYYSNVIPTIGSWFVAWERLHQFDRHIVIQGRVHDVAYSYERENDWATATGDYFSTMQITIFLKSGEVPDGWY